MIPVIYNFRGEYPKTAFYPIACSSWNKKPQMNQFSTRDQNEHRNLKKKVASVYTMKSMLEMEPAMDSCSKLFMQKLHEQIRTGKTIDLGVWLQFYAFDIVGEISFGRKFGFLEKGSDVDYIMKAIEIVLAYNTITGQIPILHKFLLGFPGLARLIPQVESSNEVLNFTLRAIESKTFLSFDGKLLAPDNAQKAKDMRSQWLSVPSSSPLKMNTRELIVALSTNVFAGSDTTAIALRSVFYHLCKTPHAMSRLVAEIEANASHLSQQITYKEATALPYLNAVIKEALRIHPSVGLLLERHVPAGGATICGERLPGGTIVGINAWFLHFYENIFPEPETFIPERWMDSSPEKLAEMERSFFAFGAGSRACSGRNWSMIELMKIVPMLVKEFEIRFVGSGGENIEGEWRTRNMWFVQQKGFECVLAPRKRA